MKIASTFELTAAEAEQLAPATLVRVSDAAARDDASLLKLLAGEGADILVTERMPPAHLLAAWREARGATVVVLVAETFGDSECMASHEEGAIAVFFSRSCTPVDKALAAAEGLHAREVTGRQALQLLRGGRAKKGERVLVVGSGIVSLMTAMHLVDNGYKVEVVEKSVDPRTRPDWTSLGCTHGGENARMFSLTECDNYHDRECAPGARPHGHIEASIAQGGWRVGHRARYAPRDEAWVREFLDLPIFLANKYNEDIFALNHESFKYWNQLIEARPYLFDNVEFRQGLLRIASSDAYHHKQLKRQQWVGSFQRELDQATVISDYPALADGCRNGEVVGGIEVRGFSVNVHGFVNNLVSYLTTHGASFHWGADAQRIAAENGVVQGLVVNGELMKSDHYFLSPGVYGANLLDGTLSDNKVHGVLGAWISFPNLAPRLQRALKISRPGHLANSGNIIPAKSREGEDILIFGSGFGYVGRDLANIDEEQMEALFASMEDYIEHLFPAAFRQAMDSGQLRASRRYCIRPWTASSLGVFEMKKAQGGLLVIASGHNTGGFSQGTGVARATLDALQGRLHPMHTLYHPKRFEDFWFARAQAPSSVLS